MKENGNPPSPFIWEHARHRLRYSKSASPETLGAYDFADPHM
jgi:hypothetical protein